MTTNPSSSKPTDAMELVFEIMSITDSMTGGTYVRDKLAALIESAQSKAVNLAMEQRDRYHLWASHGHEGLYGDDGEMQCTQCHVDYKRDDMAVVQAAVIKAKTSARAALDAHDAEVSLAEAKWWDAQTLHGKVSIADHVERAQQGKSSCEMCKRISELESILAEARSKR